MSASSCAVEMVKGLSGWSGLLLDALRCASEGDEASVAGLAVFAGESGGEWMDGCLAVSVAGSMMLAAAGGGGAAGAGWGCSVVAMLVGGVLPGEEMARSSKEWRVGLACLSRSEERRVGKECQP